MGRRWIGVGALGALLLAFSQGPVEAQQVPGGGPTSDVEVLVLSPEPGATVDPGAVLVAVSFLEPDRLDVGSLLLEVDGRDVTSQANVGAYTLRWRPPAVLAPGPHRVSLTGRDRSGLPLEPLEWTFTVASSDEPADRRPGDPPPPLFSQPWAPSGTVVFESASQNASGSGADFRRDESFVPRLWVNAAGTIASGWRYSTRIHVSGYESSNRQPVNRFRFDVRSNRLNVALGDVNPNLQDVMLAGRRVRGFQGDVSAGPVQLEMVAGQTRRAIDGIIDPDDPFALLRTGTFGQNLFAIRPSVGRGERFRVGVTMLRVRDDVNSLDLDLRTSPDPVSGGTLAASPLPRDNLVAGTDFTLRMMDGRVLVQYENGISFYANDISDGPLTEAALDSIMQASGFRPMEIDPSKWERFFIMNASMIPLDPRGFTNVAHQFRSSVRAGIHMVSFEYRHVGGSYYTLGYPSLQRDQAGFRIRDSFTVLGNALALSAGVERFQDNLDEIKPATTTSTGVFADASWQPSRDRIGLTGSFRVGSRSNGLASGTDGAMDEGNWAVSGGITYPFLQAPLGFLDRYRTEALLNVSLINRDDPQNPTVGSKNIFVLTGLRGETPDRGSEFSVLYGINRSELTGFDDATSTFHRAMANMKRPVRPRWSGTLDGTVTLARSPESVEVMGVDYNRFEVMAGAQWEWEATSLVTFGVGFASYSDSRFDDRDTREILTRIRVSRAF
jgi:hypothetical protein